MKTEHGDILQAKDALIFIPVNMVGVMGAGLAKQFAHKYPRLHTRYRAYCRDNSIRDSVVRLDNFIMFPTKDHWKDSSNLQDMIIRLEWVLDTLGLNMDADEEKLSIAIPKIGCGYGGLDWEHQVRPAILPIILAFENQEWGAEVILYE